MRAGVRPIALTYAQVVGERRCALAYAAGLIFSAGFLVLFTGTLDILDGKVARRSNGDSPRGAFLDSVMDRYAEFVGYVGLMVFFGSRLAGVDGAARHPRRHDGELHAGARRGAGRALRDRLAAATGALRVARLRLDLQLDWRSTWSAAITMLLAATVTLLAVLVATRPQCSASSTSAARSLGRRMRELRGKGWRVLGYFVWMLGAGRGARQRPAVAGRLLLAVGAALFAAGVWQAAARRERAAA